MTRPLVLLLGLGVALFVALFVARAVFPVSSAPAVVVAPPAARAPQWTRVADWSGSGIKQTESFTTHTREWRIHWETSAEAFPGAGILQIAVHNANDNLIALAANVQGIGRDVSYVRAPAGSYYLAINSANVTWTIRVEAPR